MNESGPPHAVEVADGMRIEWDVPITMDDGLVVRADVFRPDDDGCHPVILTYGPYGKGFSFQDALPNMWKVLADEHPDALEGSSNRYQVWETVDPEKWVPDGYVCVRVDSRGAGRSPGFLDCFSPRETQDLYDCIEWAGVQGWSSGKVGLTGISYYAMNQWQVAPLAPPHLAAICPWEGASDFYRDQNHHGGILNPYISWWAPSMVHRVQHGVGGRGARSSVTGALTAGPETLSPEELGANRTDLYAEVKARELDDDWYRARSGNPEKVSIPLLSANNWNHPLHSRGNYEGYMAARGPKWLEVHGYEHWVEFYTEYGVGLQKEFFDHFLKGEDNGWDERPAVSLQVRHADGSFHQRFEQEWPIPDTRWTKLHLDAGASALRRGPVGEVAAASFDGIGEGVTFLADALDAETELTGPLAATLYVSSSTDDADLFLVLRVLDLDGKDVTFTNGVGDPNGLLANGWLRVSHRRLDPGKSLPYRPWHTHDALQPLEPGEIVEVEVEIWPTSIVIPPGYQVGLSIWGRDFELPGDGPWPTFEGGVTVRGNGPVLHDDPDDRPLAARAGTTTIHTGGEHDSYLLLPVIPSRADRQSNV